MSFKQKRPAALTLPVFLVDCDLSSKGLHSRDSVLRECEYTSSMRPQKKLRMNCALTLASREPVFLLRTFTFLKNSTFLVLMAANIQYLIILVGIIEVMQKGQSIIFLWVRNLHVRNLSMASKTRIIYNSFQKMQEKCCKNSRIMQICSM